MERRVASCMGESEQTGGGQDCNVVMRGEAVRWCCSEDSALRWKPISNETPNWGGSRCPQRVHWRWAVLALSRMSRLIARGG